MLKSGIETLASSADAIDTGNESIDYVKMIETFRRYDKKGRGYLSKNKYKKFLHGMKIYQTEEFEEITYRALVTENQANDNNETFQFKLKNKNKNDNDDNEPKNSEKALGITFEMARIICETFGSSSLKPDPQALKQINKARRASNSSVHSQNMIGLNLANSDEDQNVNNSNDNKNENGVPNLKLRENEDENDSNAYRSSDTQLNSTDNGNMKVQRNLSAPIPKESHISDFFPLSRRPSKTKTEKNGYKTKMSSLILFRGADADRDGKIDFNQFKSIAKIVDINMKDEDIFKLFENCLPDPDRHLVTYANVAKQLFDVFVWGNEDPYQQKIVNNTPISRICILI